MRIPDNLDIFEQYEREQERRIRRMTRLELEEELGFRTIDEANEEREED